MADGSTRRSKSKQKELKRDTAILREFDASTSRDLLVLYHHVRDAAFDAFSSAEYTAQMIRYCKGGFKVVMVTPRRIEGNDYSLVCLQHVERNKNTLCQLAFLCFRQFVGASMLVKKRCFACNKPTTKACTGCRCAYFCSRECQAQSWSQHKELCKLVKCADITVEKEVIKMVV